MGVSRFFCKTWREKYVHEQKDGHLHKFMAIKSQANKKGFLKTWNKKLMTIYIYIFKKKKMKIKYFYIYRKSK